MKNLVLSIFYSMFFALLAGVSIAMVTDWPPLAISATLFAASFIPMPSGVMGASVLKQIFTKKVIEEFDEAEKGTFLDGIEDYSQYVSNVGDEAQAIHMAYMGVAPDVLINNTTYPIPVQSLGDEDVTISLDKFQTKATAVTDDELYAATYDKIGTIKRKHGRAIGGAKVKKAIHSLAPSAQTAKMPIIITTGGDDGTGRKRLIWADILTLKTQLDNLEVPEEGRRLVLCNEHINDLLSIDEKFKDQFYSKDGGLYSRLGFDFYKYAHNPAYEPATKAKLAFAAAATGTSQKASVFFSLSRASKAAGWTKMYFSEAKNNPETQRNLINFRHNFIVLPTREEARGAIVSDNV